MGPISSIIFKTEFMFTADRKQTTVFRYYTCHLAKDKAHLFTITQWHTRLLVRSALYLRHPSPVAFCPAENTAGEALPQPQLDLYHSGNRSTIRTTNLQPFTALRSASYLPTRYRFYVGKSCVQGTLANQVAPSGLGELLISYCCENRCRFTKWFKAYCYL